jgi:hypothetical protein
VPRRVPLGSPSDGDASAKGFPLMRLGQHRPMAPPDGSIGFGCANDGGHGCDATMETVTIGGLSQRLWFRGVSQSNPASRRCSAATTPPFNSISWSSRGSSIEDGPRGLIEALLTALGPAGTLVMPSMSDDDDHPFDPRETPCVGMGVVADMFWRMPAVIWEDRP